jgi:hypothetical protein
MRVSMRNIDFFTFLRNAPIAYLMDLRGTHSLECCCATNRFHLKFWIADGAAYTSRNGFLTPLTAGRLLDSIFGVPLNSFKGFTPFYRCMSSKLLGCLFRYSAFFGAIYRFLYLEMHLLCLHVFVCTLLCG